jgi:hypothetical protein
MQNADRNRVSVHLFRLLRGVGEGPLGVVAFAVVFVALIAATIYLATHLPFFFSLLKLARLLLPL